MKKIVIVLFFALFSPVLLEAQYAQYQFDNDSVDYPYFMPILGKKTVAAGFDIPYPLGIGINSFLGKAKYNNREPCSWFYN